MHRTASDIYIKAATTAQKKKKDRIIESARNRYTADKEGEAQRESLAARARCSVASYLPHNVLQRHYTDACVRAALPTQDSHYSSCPLGRVYNRFSPLHNTLFFPSIYVYIYIYNTRCYMEGP